MIVSLKILFIVRDEYVAPSPYVNGAVSVNISQTLRLACDIT